MLVEPVPCHTIYDLISAFVDNIINTAAPSFPPPRPLSSLLASSIAWRGQLLSALSLSHLIMAHSAVSTTPRHHFPPFLATVGHSTVSTINTKGMLFVDPSVARNTLKSSTRQLGPVLFWSAWSRILPTSHRLKHHPTG